MLYLRMGVTMLVSLYTSRVVLATLGVDDFGIYNVVGSVIVLFSFMNITLTVAIRRFLAYELGQAHGGRIQKVFNASIIAVFLTSLLMVAGLESLGYWFLNHQLNIPPDRMLTANLVYQFSVLSFFFSVNLIPFSSAIVAYEKMGAYAWLGIAETVLKLGLVLALPFLVGDKLWWYGLLMALLAVFMTVCNYLYCHLKVIRPKSVLVFQWEDVLSIFRFSAWTVFGTMVFMLATQGVNMIYNIFFGVAMNAALGIGQQVANAVNQFVGNFQTAFNPQLTKSYAAEGLSAKTFGFVCQTSRLSLLLILLIGVPIIANAAPILQLWLVDVPDYAVPFTIIFIIYMAIDGASGPLYYLVYAKGELKLYQMVLGGIQLVYVVMVYLLCLLGMNPVIVLSLNLVTGVVIYVARLLILKRILTFPVRSYIQQVIRPLWLPILLFVGMILVNTVFLLVDSMMLNLCKIVLSVLLCALVGFCLYLNQDERRFVLSLVQSGFNRK